MQVAGQSQKLVAEFFGTDYNFLYSKEMQKTLFENCLAVNFQQLMDFKAYHLVDAQRELYMGAGVQLLNFDTEMNTYIQTSFNTSRKFIRMGLLSFLCYFLCCYTIWFGIVPLIQNAFGPAPVSTDLNTKPVSNATIDMGVDGNVTVQFYNTTGTNISIYKTITPSK